MTALTNPLATISSPGAAGSESFATVLRAAIDASGLGLARINDHLRRRGVSVSIATLSYWQNGHSVPGRRSTLCALVHLEEVLRVAPGTLTARVPRAAKFTRGARTLRVAPMRQERHPPAA